MFFLDTWKKEVGMYMPIINKLKSIDSIELGDESCELVKYHLKYYIRKANSAKNGFLITNILVIVLNAVVPIVSLNEAFGECTKVVIAIAGAVTSIVVAYSTLRSHKLSWERYRKYAENLKALIRENLHPCSKMSKEVLRCRFIDEMETIIKGDVNRFVKHVSNLEATSIEKQK